jgi:hypothetical protein
MLRSRREPGPGVWKPRARPPGLRAEEVRSMSATDTQITVDRSVIEEFIAKVDGLASYDTLLNGNDGESRMMRLIYGVLEDFEKKVLPPMSEEDAEALHDRAGEYGREYFAGLVEEVAS